MARSVLSFSLRTSGSSLGRTGADAANLCGLVQELASRAQLPMPRVYIIRKVGRLVSEAGAGISGNPIALRELERLESVAVVYVPGPVR